MSQAGENGLPVSTDTSEEKTSQCLRFTRDKVEFSQLLFVVVAMTQMCLPQSHVGEVRGHSGVHWLSPSAFMQLSALQSKHLSLLTLTSRCPKDTNSCAIRTKADQHS